MIKEGREIAAIHPNMVVKIPMTVEGLKAVKVLSAEGIKCNVTLIFSANQALLAARAGAAYVSPFLGRLDDISQPGIELIRTISDIFMNYPEIETEIIAASVRNPIHVTACAMAGADIATVPYSVLEAMTKHPLTDAGIEKFVKDYQAVLTGWLPDDEGTFRDYLLKDPKNNVSKIVKEGTPGAKEAILDYEVIDMMEDSKMKYTYCLIHLETGRHHQIRVQTSSRGFGIWGDTKNNQKIQKPKKSYKQIGLHPSRLEFEHPDTREHLI